jgi:hypothetical protein
VTDLGWQDLAAWVIVALAAAFLVDRFFLSARRKRRNGSKKPDVPVSALVRKRPNKRR